MQIKTLAALLLVFSLLGSSGTPAPTEPPTAPAESESGSETQPAQSELTVTDPAISELRAELNATPGLERINLTGSLPEFDALIALKNDYPAIVFVWEFDFCGKTVNTLTESVDLSGTPVSDVQALEALLPAFYDLKTVDMCRCGIANEEMDALNRRHSQTQFVWEVQVCSVRIRTDATYFMPVKFNMPDHLTNDFSNLRYCTQMVLIDLGHYVVNDTSFVEYMPDLQYLQLCMATIDDLTSIGHCTSLRMLELFLNPATDFWPLTNLTNLEDLNISNTSCVYRYSPRRYEEFGDVTPLLQMTWLDRLWAASDMITETDELRLRQALPETSIVCAPGSSTDRGWRYCPNYYAARDMLGMEYMFA